MRRLNLVSVVFAALALLTLSACQTGGGYSGQSWDYTQGAKPAEAPPKPLSDIYGEQSTVAAARTGVDFPQTEEEAAQQQAAFGQEPLQPPADNLPPVKVALLLPLSGQHEALGQAMLQAAQIALFDVGHGHFELLPRDTGGTAAGARNAAQAAVNEGAQLILGPVFSESVRAVAPVARRARINVIGFSTDWAQAGGHVYLMGFMPFDQVERIARYAATQNVGRIGVIAPDTDYGRTVTAAYQNMAAHTGLRTVDVVSFPATSSNLAPTLRTFTKYDERTAMKDADGVVMPSDPPFEAVFMPVGGELATSISNLLSHYELPPQVVRRMGTGLFDNLGLATESSMDGAWFAAPSPGARAAFEKRFLSTYNTSPPRLASLAYDATALAAVLAQRGLKTTREPAFDRNAITNPNGFAGIDGIFRFRPNGTAERGLAVLEFRRGRFVVIDEPPRTFQQYTPF